jgi:hypothetical protein
VSYYKFEQNDIFTNRIKAHPRTYFLINNSKIYYNNDVMPFRSGSTTDTIQNTEQGYLSLHEININRDNSPGSGDLIYPFVTKQGSLESFKTVSTEAFQNFQYGNEISGSYPMSASISTDHYAASAERPRITALKNTFNHYKPHSRHYSFETPGWNKATQEMKLVSIPSIFFGSSIKKGSVKMNFYVSGSLVATLEDKARNGELVQTLPDDVNAGKVAGVVLYNEGFVALTGSWDISPTHTTETYESGAAAPKWSNWGFFGATHSSWDIDFLGTNYIPTMTMLAHAKQGDLNHSNNPTFIDYEDRNDNSEEISLSPNKFTEDTELKIANVVKSPYANHSASFEKTTYISKIGIYDEDKNLIGIAKLATPVKKTESRQYTFKMKIDF